MPKTKTQCLQSQLITTPTLTAHAHSHVDKMDRTLSKRYSSSRRRPFLEWSFVMEQEQSTSFASEEFSSIESPQSTSNSSMTSNLSTDTSVDSSPVSQTTQDSEAPLGSPSTQSLEVELSRIEMQKAPR